MASQALVLVSQEPVLALVSQVWEWALPELVLPEPVLALALPQALVLKPAHWWELALPWEFLRVPGVGVGVPVTLVCEFSSTTAVSIGAVSIPCLVYKTAISVGAITVLDRFLCVICIIGLRVYTICSIFIIRESAVLFSCF